MVRANMRHILFCKLCKDRSDDYVTYFVLQMIWGNRFDTYVASSIRQVDSKDTSDTCATYAGTRRVTALYFTSQGRRVYIYIYIYIFIYIYIHIYTGALRSRFQLQSSAWQVLQVLWQDRSDNYVTYPILQVMCENKSEMTSHILFCK